MIINTEKYTIELVEKNLVDVELVEKELVTIDLHSIDILNNIRQFTESLSDYLVINELPTKLSERIFQTENDYIADSLIVYFNGIKERYINKLSDNTFSFNIDILDTDDIEISYIKKI